MQTSDDTSSWKKKPSKSRRGRGRLCCAINCNSSSRKNPGISFYSFPNDKDRCAKWVQNTRRADLRGKPTSYLRQKCRLCIFHFEESQILCTKRLVWNAVPTLFDVPNPPKKITVKRKLPKRTYQSNTTSLRKQLFDIRCHRDHTYCRSINADIAPTSQEKGKMQDDNHHISKIMDNSKICALITKEDLKAAYDVVRESPLCVRTPIIHQCQQAFGIEGNIDLHLKLESSQTTGSFKVRGLANQMAHLPERVSNGDCHVITMSAGNYGKALSYAANELGILATVIMPKTAPDNRALLMRDYGSKVEKVDISELQSTVDDRVAKEGMYFCHPFDDLHLIAGHGSVGLEILEDVPNPDIVLVCCGGGGLLAGTAAAIKLHCQSPCRVYGVEPKTACTMYQSRATGVPVTDHSCHSIAAGLSPPYAGKNCFAHNEAFVDEMLLVSDSEIISAVKHLYNAGLKVEPSGAAAFAALLHHKVPDVSGKKVVVVITGGNVSPAELTAIKF